MSGYDLEPVDVIVGGSPCQDLSVAQKNREGLDGERSGLFLEQIRIVKEMRDADRVLRGRTGIDVRPRFLVWENVEGCQSSNGKRDFQKVLTEIVRIVKPNAPDVPLPEGRWSKAGCLFGVGDDGQPFSIAWRVHNAQYWGVAQRRVRISVVGDFGAGSASEILFDRNSVYGIATESKRTQETTPKNTGRCSERANSMVQESEGAIVIENHGNDSRIKIKKDGVAQTLSGRMGTGGNNTPFILQPSGTWSIGNGQIHDAMSPVKEVSKTLNALHDVAGIVLPPKQEGECDTR